MINSQKTVVVQAFHLSKVVKSLDLQIDILQDIDLCIYEGEVVAILGSSGSGKTSLLSILAGLDDQYEGMVKLLGHSLSGLTEDARAALRRGQVGFVFQSFLLIPELSAFENVTVPLEIQGSLSKKSMELAKEMLRKVGLGNRMDHYPNTLSGGEQQRVALARAFVGQPKLLFVDEPTGSLDHENGQLVLDLMLQLNAQFQTTIVMVTHDLEIAKKCDRILSINHGKLNEIVK